MEAFFRLIDRAIVAIAGVVVLAAILHIAADVSLKYLFAAPIPGTIIYVSNYYMTAIVFLPLVSAELRNQHIAVDLWPSRLPRAFDRAILRLVWALSAAVYGLLAWNTLIDANRKFDEGEFVLDQGGQVSTWPSYYLLPIGFTLIAALLLCKIIKPELGATSTELPPDV